MTQEKIQDAVYTRRYIYNFHYHLIWVTKYRHQTFVTKELADEMKVILQGVADDNEIVIEKMEVMPDHVHVLISFPPSYYMSILGNMSKDVVENYINNQKYNEQKKRPKRR
ncbi:IS200/IS605 family transposase [Lacticaseibacillus chiayiensis]|uniref:IS200/IS605 family transposase n=1 Tax=Lacticaseibacillus chiayiensis TaxID=2100821 RepID=UPI001BCC2097|nr:IS200/IS605 family transposase [Lacticaseibacillus chiayiensis]QVI35559.1 IS200/IS605 family transposase [Lacticaseibacillus chiayiensis]